MPTDRIKWPLSQWLYFNKNALKVMLSLLTHLTNKSYCIHLIILNKNIAGN
uniref:Uncharacterized protein n=1 Tax=Rhizophora mucronata TaxID=61149 RepID=A0A2P2LF95_RHIMU